MKKEPSINKLKFLLTGLFVISLFFNFSVSFSQEKKQKLYRIHVKDFKKIQSIEKTGINIYNAKPGAFIDVLASPDKIMDLQFEDFDIEFLSNSFKELIEKQLSPKALAQYHDYDDTMEELIEISNNFPAITKLDTIGHSVLGRAICAIKVSDNPEIDEDELPILIVGCHHGNEILSVEATLYQLNYLVDNYETNAEVAGWVNNMEIWFVPLMNPDGREAMRRTNENSVDLNRNYSFEHTATGNHGSEGFSEPETRAIRDLAALFPPVLSLTYHTSGRLLLYSWTHTDEIAPDSATMTYIGGIISDSITYPTGNTTGHYELRQGGDWYFTAGEYCDYMYATYNTMAFTVEMWTSQSPEPSVIQQVVERNLEGFLTMLRQAERSGITGHITDEITGLPIQATIEVAGIYDQGKLSPLKSDETFGRYYRYIEPGSHALIVSAPGYETSIHYATTHDNRLTTLNISMEQAALIELDNTIIVDLSEGDISGNGNGLVNINETIGLNLSFINPHSIDVNNAYAIISSSSTYVNMLEDSVYIGDIAANTTKSSSDQSLFYVSPLCSDEELLEFIVTISDSTNTIWVDNFTLEVYAPVVEIQDIIIDDSGGNQNGVLNNGESGILEIIFYNSGRQEINNLSGLVRTSDTEYQLLSGTQNSDKLEAGGVTSLRYELELSALAPQIHVANFQVDISSEELYSNVLEFSLSNVNGYYDSFEGGQESWTHGSYGTTSNNHDDWQLGEPAGKVGDPSSAWSGENCWGNDMGWNIYLGVTWNGLYQHEVYSYLESPEIDCSGLENVGLQYKRWLNLDHSDYEGIKVNNHIVWMSPASGNTDTEWTDHLIDISEFADNNPNVIIKFELRTNEAGDAGGWNIDDVVVADGLISGGSGIESDIYTGQILFDAYPNPFSIYSTINYYLSDAGHAEIRVLDSYGRVVKTLVFGVHNPGNHQVSWDGKNDKAYNLPAGIYFYQLKTENNVSVKRIVLVK